MSPPESNDAITSPLTAAHESEQGLLPWCACSCRTRDTGISHFNIDQLPGRPAGVVFRFGAKQLFERTRRLYPYARNCATRCGCNAAEPAVVCLNQAISKGILVFW